MPRVSNKKNGPSQIELPLFSAPAGQRRLPSEESPRQVSAAAVVEAAAKPQVESPKPVAVAASPARPGLRVIQGGGERKHESLASRDAVVRVLVEAGADLLLRRISPERAEEIERKVDRVLRLFDQVDGAPMLMPVLQRQLDDLEALMRETRNVRSSGRR